MNNEKKKKKEEGKGLPRIVVGKEVQIELSPHDILQVIRTVAQQNPEIVKIILKNSKGYCPFPDMCRSFPYKTLSCNADVCENGYVYRMS